MISQKMIILQKDHHLKKDQEEKVPKNLVKKALSKKVQKNLLKKVNQNH